MNAFEFGNELWNLFTNDETLVKLLDVDVDDESSYVKHYRQEDVAPIRKRIVDIIHERFDERVRAEGQRSSGITNVYKYRLEFTPLIFT